MKNNYIETQYEKLYNSNLKDIGKNLESFVKSKEQDFLENRAKTKEE